MAGGVSGPGFEKVVGKERGGAEEGKTLRRPRKERRLNNRQSTMDLPCCPGYSWKTAVPVSVAYKSSDF